MLRFMVLGSSLFVLGACGSPAPAGSGGGGGECPNIPLGTVPVPDRVIADGQRILIAVDGVDLFSVTTDARILKVPRSGGEEVTIGLGEIYVDLTAGAPDLYLTTVDDDILRLTKDGSSKTAIAVHQINASGSSQSLAADDAHVYWAGEGPLPVIAGPPTMGFLRRSDPDGSNVVDLATNLRAPGSVLVDGGLVVWAEQGSFAFTSNVPPDGTIRALPAGGGPAVTLASELVGAVVRGHRDGFVWFGAGPDLYRVADTGGTPTLMIHGASQAAIGATAVYWLENVSSAQHTLLLRTPIAGGCPTPLALVDGAQGPLALDDAEVYVMMPQGVAAVPQ
jgi:hypothetical protein